MPMPPIHNRVGLTPLELEGERFSNAAWRRFEKFAKDGYGKRLLASDFTAFIDAVYDQYIESKSGKSDNSEHP